MNCESFDRLRLDASAELFAGEAESAKKAVSKKLIEMVQQGDVNILTDEEERMLRAFRRFKMGCKAGAVFKWQTRPTEGVLVSQETGLIADPQECVEVAR